MQIRKCLLRSAMSDCSDNKVAIDFALATNTTGAMIKLRETAATAVCRRNEQKLLENDNWKDYKKLKTYLILKDKLVEKVNTRRNVILKSLEKNIHIHMYV